MSFADDRDLIAIEPTLLRDVAFAAQRRLVGTCDVAGDTMTLTAFDHDLSAAGVEAGFVAQIAGVPTEILAVLSPTPAHRAGPGHGPERRHRLVRAPAGDHAPRDSASGGHRAG